MTRFSYFTLNHAHTAKGVVVVIDVLRAFTTAAHAFDAGAERILPVAGVEEAFLLRKTFSDALMMGEVDGIKPDGFDFGNSPAQFDGCDLTGYTMIQRTSAGTQGIVKAEHAELLFAASFVVAKATALTIQKLAPAEVSFVITGILMGRDGDEDRACAEYIQALIQNKKPLASDYTRRVSQSTAGLSFLSEEHRDLLKEDLDLSVQQDRFSFSMPVFRQGTLLVMSRNFL